MRGQGGGGRCAGGVSHAFRAHRTLWHARPLWAPAMVCVCRGGCPGVYMCPVDAVVFHLRSSTRGALVFRGPGAGRSFPGPLPPAEWRPPATAFACAVQGPLLARGGRLGPVARSRLRGSIEPKALHCQVGPLCPASCVARSTGRVVVGGWGWGEEAGEVVGVRVRTVVQGLVPLPAANFRRTWYWLPSCVLHGGVRIGWVKHKSGRSLLLFA